MSAPEPEPQPEAVQPGPPQPEPRREQVTIRRAPKLSVFIAIGAFLGVLTTLILTSQYPTDPAVGFPATVGYFLLFGIPAGVVLGAAVGLLIDAASRRRARTVDASRELIDVVDDRPRAPEPAEPRPELPEQPEQG